MAVGTEHASTLAPGAGVVAAPASPDKASVGRFVGAGADYYEAAFGRIQNARGFVVSFNTAAALLGPVWAGARGVWGLFWFGAFMEALSWTQLARGAFGDLGGDELTRAARLKAVVATRLAEAAAATAAGNAEAAATAQRLADNLQKAADAALQSAAVAASGATLILIVGACLLVGSRLVQGLLANAVYERQYTAWRTDPTVPSGVRPGAVALSAVLLLVIVPLTAFRFAVKSPPSFLVRFPADRSVFKAWAQRLDDAFDVAYRFGSGAFDGIRDAIRVLVDGLETVLVEAPWPAVMIVIVVLAWRLAGARVAIFSAAAIAYLAFLGLWEISMQTVALLGTATVICIAIGIPLGVWFGRSERAYAAARPVLDFMQTMPSFVYLIPVIAFFGTGKPPGIIATMIYGTPPVTRLTALGMKQVPEHVKEAARAFGASNWQLLTGVELPLAMPAIMTGVNQTILMCLSMVVVASLIGARGLGSEVLEALQYAAKGQGMLTGIAILLCAMVIDRIVQGRFQRAG
jgi:glycine betaine/proline transport system permease protein